MGLRHIRILNNMAFVGSIADSVINSDTMSSVSLCKNDIPGSSLDVSKHSVSPKMPRSGAQSQVLRMPAIFVNSVYSPNHTSILLNQTMQEYKGK